MPRSPVTREPTTSTALLDTLTNSAALPALVEKLEPGELKRLVDAVGLEDAGTLVSYASPAQLAYLIDESVWVSVNPGDPESLSVAELLRWFDLWLDLGDGFIAEKLIELGEGFCALAFARLVTVTSADLAPGEVDEYSMVQGEYVVRANVEDEWDTLQAALVALWDEDADFLEALLARLSFRHSILGIDGENDAERVLEADASHERETRKEAAGFVGATTAGAFLRGIVAAELDALLDERSYDPASARYFERRKRQVEAPRADAGGAGGRAEPRQTTRAIEAELDQLQRELERYELRRSEHVALLTGPQRAPAAVEVPIRRALAALIDDPERFEARTAELAYLANLVMADVVLDEHGATMSQADAANLVIATCNLGAGYVLWADAREREAESLDPFIAMLREAPGLVRLFRIGWKLISQLPVQTAIRLRQALSADAARQHLSVKPWLADEIEALLNQPDLVEVVRSGDFAQARETIKVLAIALESQAAAALCLLVAQVPRLAQILEPGTAQPRFAGTVDADARYITSMQDLRLADQFLAQLPGQVRV